MVKTRFAPSPTGDLHIGGARTALFNWLYAQHNNGLFFFRIDDTDKTRSQKQFLKDIIINLTKLGIISHQDRIYQSNNISSHIYTAKKMLKTGAAYYCCASRKEIDGFYQNNPGKKFVSPYRNKAFNKITGAVLRLKIPLQGSIVLQDKVLGMITIQNKQIDDLILLRSNGSPTYILSSTVDDYNMGITNIIRGNDHLTNTFKQLHIIKSLNWDMPRFAHIPLILDKQGHKISKRESHATISKYFINGYLANAFNNYMLGLGWSCKNETIVTIIEAQKIFDLKNISKSPSKFDIHKLNYLNRIYLRNTPDWQLYNIILQNLNIRENFLQSRVKQALPMIKSRCTTIIELINLGKTYIYNNILVDRNVQIILHQYYAFNSKNMILKFANCKLWKLRNIERICQKHAYQNHLNFSLILKILRVLIFYRIDSPPLFESMIILGKHEVLKRVTYPLPP